MFIISAFEHSLLLELAISDLETEGLAKENIFAAPLERKPQPVHILDTIHRADGISQLDGAFLTGAFLSVVFTVFGYILPGGPLMWGLLGVVTGFGGALIIDVFLTRRRRQKKTALTPGQVVLIVKCDESQAAFVEKVLNDHGTMGLARVK